MNSPNVLNPPPSEDLMYLMHFESFSAGRWCFRWEGSGWDKGGMFREGENEVEKMLMER
jgi:hypothetical protein